MKNGIWHGFTQLQEYYYSCKLSKDGEWLFHFNLMCGLLNHSHMNKVNAYVFSIFIFDIKVNAYAYYNLILEQPSMSRAINAIYKVLKTDL